jgi:hypothetical protein
VLINELLLGGRISVTRIEGYIKGEKDCSELINRPAPTAWGLNQGSEGPPLRVDCSER